MALAQPCSRSPASASSCSTPGWRPAASTAARPAEIRAFHPSEGGNDRRPQRPASSATSRSSAASTSRSTTIPQHVRAGLRRHRGPPLLRAQRPRLARLLPRRRHATCATCGMREGFSTITMQVARNSFLVQSAITAASLRRKLIELRTHATARERAHQGPDPRALPQRHLPRQRRERRRGGEPRSVRQERQQAHADRGRDARRAAQGARARTRRATIPSARSQRRNLVLALMARAGLHHAAAQAATAARTPLASPRTSGVRDTGNEPLALDAVRAFVDSVLPDALKEGDVTVYTTLDCNAQRAADRAVLRQTAVVTRETQYAGGRVTEAAQGALVALDPRTGDIRALVPAGARSAADSIARSTRSASPARRSSRSSTPRRSRPGMTPGHARRRRAGRSGAGTQRLAPSELQRRATSARITFARALAVSSNAATVRVSQTIGDPERHRGGAPQRHHESAAQLPAIALGAVDVTPLELVAAYAPFANGGMRVHAAARAPHRSAPTARCSGARRSRPRDTVDGSARRVSRSRRCCAASWTTAPAARFATWACTGRSPERRARRTTRHDVWFVGYTPTLVAGVWFGYDTPRPIAPHASGGRLAAPAWAEFYLNGWREPASSADGWTPPPGMTMRAHRSRDRHARQRVVPDARSASTSSPAPSRTEVCNVHTEPAYEEQHSPDTDRRRRPDPARRRRNRQGLRKIFRF